MKDEKFQGSAVHQCEYSQQNYTVCFLRVQMSCVIQYVNPKEYILYDYFHIKAKHRQNYGDRNQKLIACGEGGGDDQKRA